MSNSDKEYRKELVSHLWHEHGNFSSAGMKLTLEELEEYHKAFHIDKHMCPKHSHIDPGPFTIGEVKLKFGPDYLKELLSAFRGEE